MEYSRVSKFLLKAMDLKANATKTLLEGYITALAPHPILAFKTLFKYMLCPSIIFNIKAVPGKAAPYFLRPIQTDIELCAIIEYMLDKDLRGKRLKNLVASIDKACTPEMAQVFEWVLKKKNPAKVGKTLLNKVFPDLIRTQLYMGAIPGTEEELERMFNENEFINVQKKEDGMCILIDYTDGKPTVGRTRQGNDIGKYFPDFMASLPNLFVHTDEPIGFNGMVHHELFTGTADRKTGNGLINKQVKNAIVGGVVDNCMHSVLLDMVDFDCMHATQAIRYQNLAMFESVQTKRVEQLSFRNLSEARQWAQELIARGNEGVICKDPSAPFQAGKHRNCIKIKNEFTVELEVVGINRHSVNPDWIGSLKCMSVDGRLLVNVTARSQADKESEHSLWECAIVSVKAESIIKSKKDKPASLYLPRFDGDNMGEYIRTDKHRGDNFVEIQNQEAMSKGMM